MGTDRIVAVKHLQLKVKSATVLTEAAMLIRAQGNPNIVRFHGVWCNPTASEKAANDKQWFILMDYFCKGDLYDRVVNGKRMLEKDAIPKLHNVLSAIVFLHGRGIFHRDVKPENLLIGASKKLVLTDFGISCLVTDKDELKKPIGTVGYAAPEMLAGEATGFQGDEFGAGIVLYFMLSKSTPFLAPTPEIIIKKTKAGKINLEYGCFDHLNIECRSLILGLICKDVDCRMKAQDVLATVYMQRSFLKTSTVPADLQYAETARRSQDLSRCQELSRWVEQRTQGQLPLLRHRQDAEILMRPPDRKSVV